ncbi:MAG: NifU family protein [Candidatus Kapabacteria bacterium]|nr:NifU family protein [Ignavibacteriota bacterium]MCW5883867.1 NifU family protein [Candidatus Kapabacteria bacterium]
MNSPLRPKVESILEKLRPYLQLDGGDVEYVHYETDTRTLVLRLLGNCSGCPMALMTLRGGIERFILKDIPEIRRVEKI